MVAVDRGRMTVRVEGPDGAPVEVTAMRARELGKHGVVVGDRVRLVGDTSGRPDSLARIVVIEDRTTSLRRTADDTDPTERVVVANADQLVVVTSVTDPDPALGFLDRCVVAAYAGGLEPLLCLTKTDLASPQPLLDRYAGLEVDAVPMSREAPLEALLERLGGRMSVLVGQSGVGKSTLVNRLVPDAFRAVFFFVPYALLTAELGSAFTGEGGCYVWTRLAWGRFVAAINTVMYVVLATATMLPKVHVADWFTSRDRRTQNRSIYPDAEVGGPHR